jgi:hypothetical protein
MNKVQKQLLQTKGQFISFSHKSSDDMGQLFELHPLFPQVIL